MAQRRAFSWVLAAWLVCSPAIAAATSDDALHHLGSGLRLFDLQRYSEAAREFELALEIDPQLADARYHLAVAYFNQRRYADSRLQFEQLSAGGYQKDRIGYYLGRLDLLEGNVDGAIGRFEMLRNAEPVEDELYFLGSAYLKKGEAEKAIKVLALQTKLNPRDFRAHNLLARAYAKAGRAEDAEREYAEAGRLHDYYLRGKQELMECRKLLEARDADEAWARCSPVLETDDIDKLVAVGMLFGEFGSHEGALQAFTRALALDPESPEVNYDLAFTYFGGKDYAQARKFLEVALQLRPNFFEALALEGTVLYLLRDDAAAAALLQRAHQLRPDDVAVNKLLEQLNHSEKR